MLLGLVWCGVSAAYALWVCAWPWASATFRVRTYSAGMGGIGGMGGGGDTDGNDEGGYRAAGLFQLELALGISPSCNTGPEIGPIALVRRRLKLKPVTARIAFLTRTKLSFRLRMERDQLDALKILFLVNSTPSPFSYSLSPLSEAGGNSDEELNKSLGATSTPFSVLPIAYGSHSSLVCSGGVMDRCSNLRWDAAALMDRMGGSSATSREDWGTGRMVPRPSGGIGLWPCSHSATSLGVIPYLFELWPWFDA